MSGEQPEKKKKFGCLLTILTLLSFFAMAFIIFYVVVWRVPDNTRWADARREKIQDRLEKAMAIDPKDNAYGRFEEASQKFTKFADTVEKLNRKPVYITNLLEKPINRESAILVREHLKRNKLPVELVMEGYRIDKSQPYIQYQKHFNARAPNFLKMRGLGQFITVLGKLEQEEGHFSKAANYYLATIRMGKGLASNGSLIYGMIAVAIETMSIKPLTKMMARTDLDQSLYHLVSEQLNRIDRNHFTYRELLDVEFLVQEYAFDDIMSGNVKSLGVAPRNTVIWRLFPVKLFFGRERKVCQNYQMELMKNFPENFPRARKVFGNVKFPAVSYIAKIMTPNHIKAYGNYLLLRDRINGLKILLALQLYRTEEGHFPGSLNELVPEYLKEIPPDRFASDGKFIYKKDGKSISLYSVGPDGVDDGGKTEATMSSQQGDVIICSLKGNSDENGGSQGKNKTAPNK